jgi:hypothetical protein
MGVWGGVISQPQPYLFNSSPIIVRLQHRDHRFYSPARRVPVRNYQLVDLSRAQARSALENILHLREKLVILTPQVAIGQRFECQKITKRKMDMNIDEQAHLCQKPIEVFHNDDRLARRF